MKRILTMLALMLPMVAFGQWRVGVNGGADFNHFIIDKQYQTDYAYNDPWTGGSIGDAVKNNPMIEKVIDYTSTHADYILNRNSYQKESEQAITSALNKFLQ